MALIAASFVGILAALGIATYLIVRSQRSLEMQQRELSRQLSQLHDVVSATRQELEQLKVTRDATKSAEERQSSSDPLTQLEHLADAVSLANSNALDAAA